MNPQTTWDQLLCAFAQGNWDAIEERATELLAWLDGGGSAVFDRREINCAATNSGDEFRLDL